MSDNNRPKDSGNSSGSYDKVNGSVEKSSLPDYKHTPKPPANDKPQNNK